jgi:CspA family cold shock protein
VFVHITAVKEAGIQKLFENDKLEFELSEDAKGKGPSAVNLKKID